MMVSTNKPSNQLVTPRSRVFLNKPTDPQPGKKFLKIVSNIILQSTPRYNQFFPYFFPNTTWYVFLLYFIRATRNTHHKPTI
jgi:hypothetical protein